MAYQWNAHVSKVCGIPANIESLPKQKVLICDGSYRCLTFSSHVATWWFKKLRPFCRHLSAQYSLAGLENTSPDTEKLSIWSSIVDLDEALVDKIILLSRQSSIEMRDVHLLFRFPSSRLPFMRNNNYTVCIRQVKSHRPHCKRYSYAGSLSFLPPVIDRVCPRCGSNGQYHDDGYNNRKPEQSTKAEILSNAQTA